MVFFGNYNKYDKYYLYIAQVILIIHGKWDFGLEGGFAKNLVVRIWAIDATDEKSEIENDEHDKLYFEELKNIGKNIFQLKTDR